MALPHASVISKPTNEFDHIIFHASIAYNIQDSS